MFFIFLIISVYAGFGMIFILVYLGYNVIFCILVSFMFSSCLAIMLYNYENHYKADYINKLWRNK